MEVEKDTTKAKQNAFMGRTNLHAIQSYAIALLCLRIPPLWPPKNDPFGLSELKKEKWEKNRENDDRSKSISSL